MKFASIIFTFLGFAFFHTITAQSFFQNKLRAYFGTSFVDHYWRIIYCFLSLYLLFGVFYPNFEHNLPNHLSRPFINIDTYWVKILSQIRFIGQWLFYISLVQLDFFYYFGIKQLINGLLKQTNYRAANCNYLNQNPKLRNKGMYSIVRHPMYFGLTLMLFAYNPSPKLIVYAILYFGYLIIGLYVEEKKLIRQFGDEYINYKKNVPLIIPRMNIARV